MRFSSEDEVTLIDNPNYVGTVIDVDYQYNLCKVLWAYKGNTSYYCNMINKPTDVHFFNELKLLERSN